MALFRWIIGFLSALLLALFAVSNRHSVLFYTSPLQEPSEYPLYWIGLGFMSFGFLLGGLTVWVNSAPVRRTKRQQGRKIKTLEKELEANHDSAPSNKAPFSDFFPSLPHKAK